MTAAGAGSDSTVHCSCGVEDGHIRPILYTPVSILLTIPENIVKVERCYQDLSAVIPLVCNWCPQETSKISVRYKLISAEGGAFMHKSCLFSIQKKCESRCRKTHHCMTCSNGIIITDELMVLETNWYTAQFTADKVPEIRDFYYGWGEWGRVILQVSMANFFRVVSKKFSDKDGSAV